MKSKLEAIYHKLPFFFQNLAISAFGYYWFNRRFGGVFKQELSATKRRAFLSAHEWKNWQEQSLRRLLRHAFQQVPYYRDLLKKMGLTEEVLAHFEIEHLPTLPILEKAIFREGCTSDFLSRTLEDNGTFLHTSGSTGTPLQIRYSLRMQQQYAAIYEANVRNWAGVNWKTPRGVIGGRRVVPDGITSEPYYRYNFIEKQVYFSAYHISTETAGNYVEGMKRYGIEYLEGYASANYFLARFIEESGIQAPRLKAVLTSSEKLTPEMRDTFRRVYGCEAFDSYNGVDVCNLISECEYHRLHIVPDAGILEIVNKEGKPCLPGETGEIISTGLLNYDQPLIRYRVGDYVKLSVDQQCPCGRSMPVIDEIIGRIEDTVIGSDGREMMRFHGITINIPCIIESQVIQHELTRFEIKLVVSQQPITDELATIRKRMFSQLGDIELDIQIVPSILRGPNGKFKAVISHVSRNQAK